MVYIFFGSILIAGCSFLPGFGLLESPSLYYIPVSEVANQVACELQDFTHYYRKKYGLGIATKSGIHYLRTSKPQPQWVPGTDDASVTLKLQTDDTGSVTFTGINVAGLGFTSLAEFITKAGSVPSLGAKVSPSRTKVVTIVFAVPVTPDEVSCSGLALSPTRMLFLKEWLNNYFDKINVTQTHEANVEKIYQKQVCDPTGTDFFSPPCILDGVTFTSVDLNTQFKIAVDVSAGATPTLFGGTAFLLPINGVSGDYNPDYVNSIDIKLGICKNQNNACDTKPEGKREPWTQLYEDQCRFSAIANSVLTGGVTVKTPPDVENGTRLTCDPKQGCYVPYGSTGKSRTCAHPRPPPPGAASAPQSKPTGNPN